MPGRRGLLSAEGERRGQSPLAPHQPHVCRSSRQAENRVLSPKRLVQTHPGNHPPARCRPRPTLRTLPARPGMSWRRAYAFAYALICRAKESTLCCAGEEWTDHGRQPLRSIAIRCARSSSLSVTTTSSRTSTVNASTRSTARHSVSVTHSSWRICKRSEERRVGKEC